MQASLLRSSNKTHPKRRPTQQQSIHINGKLSFRSTIRTNSINTKSTSRPLSGGSLPTLGTRSKCTLIMIGPSHPHDFHPSSCLTHVPTVLSPKKNINMFAQTSFKSYKSRRYFSSSVAENEITVKTVFPHIPKQLDALQRRDHLLPKKHSPTPTVYGSYQDILREFSAPSCSSCNKPTQSISSLHICWNCFNSECEDCFKGQIESTTPEKLSGSGLPCKVCGESPGKIGLPDQAKFGVAVVEPMREAKHPLFSKTFTSPPKQEYTLDEIGALWASCSAGEINYDLESARRAYLRNNVQIASKFCTKALVSLNYLHRFSKMALRNPGYRSAWFKAHFLRALCEDDHTLSSAIRDKFPHLLKLHNVFLDDEDDLPMKDIPLRLLQNLTDYSPEPQAPIILNKKLREYFCGARQYVGPDNQFPVLEDKRWIFATSSEAETFIQDLNSRAVDHFPEEPPSKLVSQVSFGDDVLLRAKNDANMKVQGYSLAFRKDHYVAHIKILGRITSGGTLSKLFSGASLEDSLVQFAQISSDRIESHWFFPTAEELDLQYFY